MHIVSVFTQLNGVKIQQLVNFTLILLSFYTVKFVVCIKIYKSICVGMEAKTAFCLIIAFVSLSSINAIIVSPENYTGQLDYFLCNYTASNATIDIHFLSGPYHCMLQRSCLLQNKTSITLIGSSSNDTIIECQEPFNIVFMSVQDVIISNIKMVNCGNVVNDSINKTIVDATDHRTHFGSNFKLAIMFYQVKDLTIMNFTMISTMGYGIVAFNAIGNITIANFTVQNTTSSNHDSYYYDSDTADFNYSGSGLLMIYHDRIDPELVSVKEADTTLLITHSHFTGNRNYLPYNQFSILVDAINTGFYENSIPLQGAACITILYLQNKYDVNTIIANSMFYNNSGTISASIAIASLSTTKGKTFIQNSSFADSNRVHRTSFITSDKDFTTGGISYFYLSLMNRTKPYQHITTTSDPNSTEILTVIYCNFTKLGGVLGAAFHIRKASRDTTSLFVRIEECNFTENEANAGSAVYGFEHKFMSTLSDGLIINLVNVNAENNTLLHGAKLKFISDTFITGVFHSENCHFKFDCNSQCNFSNNQPSVLYGHFASLTISGNMIFVNNTAIYGGGLQLLNTVAFIHQNSNIFFLNNYALIYGGAIDIYFYNTHDAQDISCPIQFIGYSNQIPVSSLDDIYKLKINVTFENNNVGRELGATSKLQSIYANVFYICTWYSNTLTQIYLAESTPENGTRQSVYNTMFSFNPPFGNASNRTNMHLSILAYLPCPCDDSSSYDAQSCLSNTLKFETTVIIGRSFTISLITLDAVGSIGYSSNLYSEVFSLNTTIDLTLNNEQISRPFSIANGNCTAVNFTVFASNFSELQDVTGVLRLSLSRNAHRDLLLHFQECPVGFSYQSQSVSGQFACACGEFFNKSPITKDYQCNSVSGNIERIDTQSWLSMIDGKVEYTEFCLPGYCNNTVSKFNLTHNNSLCTRHHTRRACGKCEKSFSKKFGSRACKECDNTSLATILLYAILGIILVLIIHLLKLTVTMGTINGLIFFCNIMSIYEGFFFNPAKFSFIRIFISLINLDLGFEMCFYKEMSEIAKTGLQFVFPLYLWLLMLIIIMVGKHYVRTRKSTHSAVPVLATLILLSYSKILRTTISVFSPVTVYYSTKDSNFSELHHFVAWEPDPNVKYLEGAHIALFLVALIFTLFFIFPLAFALTFPKVVLRSKKLSYFFPVLDCIYAPYKIHCRFWFGMRLIILIYFSGMECISDSYLLLYQDFLLLSGVVVILLFALMQACIQPYKNKINNNLDLMFMVIFITLATVILYLNPNATGNEQYIAVHILGGVAFLLFCFIIIFHLHDALMHFTCYLKLIEDLKTKFNMKESWNPLISINAGNLNSKSEQSLHQNGNEGFENYAYLRESLLEEQFI